MAVSYSFLNTIPFTMEPVAVSSTNAISSITTQSLGSELEKKWPRSSTPSNTNATSIVIMAFYSKSYTLCPTPITCAT